MDEYIKTNVEINKNKKKLKSKQPNVKDKEKLEKLKKYIFKLESKKKFN